MNVGRITNLRTPKDIECICDYIDLEKLVRYESTLRAIASMRSYKGALLECKRLADEALDTKTVRGEEE